MKNVFLLLFLMIPLYNLYSNDNPLVINVLNPPSLDYPTNNLIDVAVNTGFEWSFDDNADHYQLQVAMDSNFNSFIINDSLIQDNLYTQNELIILTHYFWRVRSINYQGASEWSQIFNFKTSDGPAPTPVLIYPDSEQKKANTDVEFKWHKSNFAKKYWFEISEYKSFYSKVLSDSNITDTVYKMPIPLDSGALYYWRVRSIKNQYISKYSDSLYFTVIFPFPTASSRPIYPEVGETNVSINQNLCWNLVNFAETYLYQISTDVNFSNIVVFDSTSIIFYAPVNSYNYNTKYYWHVKSKNYMGYSPWSDTWNFITQTQYSINENTYSIKDIIIYPNPCNNNNINLKYYLEKTSNVEISIVDILGTKIYLFDDFQNEGLQFKSFDVSRFHNGSWTILIKSDSNVLYQNLIINK